MKTIRFWLGLALVLIWGIIPTAFLMAQTAERDYQIIITWTANNYYPADYSGKAWATPNTLISLGAELISNSRLQNLASFQATWYLDGKFLGRGQGLKEANFLVNKKSGESHFVRLVLERNSQIYELAINVPVGKHLAVIDAPYPNKFIEGNSRGRFEIIPYFFNITSLDDLIFGWTVNGKHEERRGNNELAINISGVDDLKIIDLSGTAQNAVNPLEFDTDKRRLSVY